MRRGTVELYIRRSLNMNGTRMFKIEISPDAERAAPSLTLLSQSDYSEDRETKVSFLYAAEGNREVRGCVTLGCPLVPSDVICIF